MIIKVGIGIVELVGELLKVLRDKVSGLVLTDVGVVKVPVETGLTLLTEITLIMRMDSG